MVLDPISALGLAGNVVQFVDFSWKLVSKGNSLYRSPDGALIENRELDIIAGDLSQLTQRLHSSLAVAGKSALLTTNDQELKNLGEACEAVAKELLTALDKLKVKEKHQKWESFGKALRTVWTKDEVVALKQRLEALRAELDTHVLLCLRTSIDLLTLRQSDLFQTLDNGTQVIIDRLLDHRESISVEFHEECIKLGKAQAHTDTLVADEHHKTRAVIIDAIKDARNLQYTSSHFRNALAASKASVYVSIETRILESLRFKTMPDRHDEIPISHKKTFEWIYRNSTEETKSWTNFAEWLQRDDEIFWIAGKAGSGKSTLMKYLYDNPKTREDLLFWSKDTPLIIAAFFFWKTGTSMQKSQIGLLQSLLYETLSQFDELIPIVLSERWKQYELYDRGSLTSSSPDWTHAELARTFRRLVTQDILPAKFCFLIDGLDEYDGDPAAIVALFKDIPSSSSIKICVSSRPIVVCEEAFDQGPMLMLQDLTYRDIELYVNDTLGEHARMLQLKEEDPENAPQLVTEIVDRASGVFLWVKLVVRSLLDGLSNFDRISDLQTRLRLLPIDLEELYRHMLQDVEPFYRIQAWKLFQIARQARSPLSPLLLSFADEDPQSTLLAKKKKLGMIEAEARCKAIERRLKSRCKGLLEIQFSSTTQHYHDRASRIFRTGKVLFLHRSVDDFLCKQDVQDMLLSEEKDDYDANHALMRSQLMRLKWIEPQVSLDLVTLADIVLEFLEYAALAEQKTGEYTIPFVEQFDEVAHEYWLQGRFERTPSLEPETLQTNDSWVEVFWTSDTGNDRGDSFLTLAIQFRLACYVQHVLTQDPELIRTKIGQPLLEYAIAPQWKKLPRPVNVKVIKVILEAGADPNMPYRGSSPWQKVLEHVYVFLPTYINTSEDASLVEQWYEVFKLFLAHGANPDACCIPGQKFKPKEWLSLPATDVVAATFSKAAILKGIELNRILIAKSEGSRKANTHWRYFSWFKWT